MSDKHDDLVKLGAADFLTKPYHSAEIIRARVRHKI